MGATVDDKVQVAKELVHERMEHFLSCKDSSEAQQKLKQETDGLRIACGKEQEMWGAEEQERVDALTDLDKKYCTREEAESWLKVVERNFECPA